MNLPFTKRESVNDEEDLKLVGVIYIGDRATGKTSLAMELINPKYNYVHITSPSYQTLKDKLYYGDEIIPTGAEAFQNPDSSIIYPLTIEVKLPGGPKNLSVEWLDTPGEVWQKSWQLNNPDKWKKVLANVRKSQGIIVVLPPYRGMPGFNPYPESPEQFPSKVQWCQRFQRWVDFFHYDCQEARQIVICLNKADLFCDINQEAEELLYHPRRSRKGWYQRHSYVLQNYFQPVQTQIQAISQKTSGSPVRCFITTIKNRDLLELPWLYLASHL
jgi:GTPase SAR1 family protein